MNRTEGKAFLTPGVRFFISCCGVEPVEREGLLIRYIAQQRMNGQQRVQGARTTAKLFISTPERPACSPQKLQDAPQSLHENNKRTYMLTRLTDSERHRRPKLSLWGNRVCKRAQVLFTLWFPSYSELREFAEFAPIRCRRLLAFFQGLIPQGLGQLLR